MLVLIQPIFGSDEMRRLIRDISIANPLTWAASRIHGEPLTLGIDVGQTTVALSIAMASSKIDNR